MTAGYVLTKTAEADREHIFDDTVERWSFAQAVTYVEGLEATFENLVRHPRIGRVWPEFGQDVRAIRYGAHKIFYRIKPEMIEILAIPHLRRDMRPEVIFRDNKP